MSYKIGVEIDGQQCITFFDPVQQTEGSICLSTIADFQTRAILKIYVCDEENSILIDEIPVNNIPPEKAGLPKIDLTVSLTNMYRLSLSVTLNDEPFENLDYSIKACLKELGRVAWPKRDPGSIAQAESTRFSKPEQQAKRATRPQDLANQSSEIGRIAEQQTENLRPGGLHAEQQTEGLRPGRETGESRTGQDAYTLHNLKNDAGHTQTAGSQEAIKQREGLHSWEQHTEDRSKRPGQETWHKRNQEDSTTRTYNHNKNEDFTTTHDNPRAYTEQERNTQYSNENAEEIDALTENSSTEDEQHSSFKAVYLLIGGGILVVVGFLVFLLSQFMTNGTGNQYLTNHMDRTGDKTQSPIITVSPVIQLIESKQTESSLSGSATQSTLQPIASPQALVLPDVTVTMIHYIEPPTTAPVQNNSMKTTTPVSDITKTIVYFQPESAELTPDTMEILDKLAPLLKPQSVVSIEGHCALFDSEASRIELSELRVKVVYAYLLKQGWKPAATPQLLGYGGQKPITYQKENQQLNRRVEIITEK